MRGVARLLHGVDEDRGVRARGRRDVRLLGGDFVLSASVVVLFAPLIFFLAIGTGSLHNVLASRALVLGGGLSYALYLVHSPMLNLFRDVTVAADEYLASAAGGLTLGELISVLGRRADGLADLWNEWGRVRPLLLSGG